jgi:glycosyltransferase involved in cell wall biosynthesis
MTARAERYERPSTIARIAQASEMSSSRILHLQNGSENPKARYRAIKYAAFVLISVVTTIRNEARNIAALLDSLVVQEPPFEILVVDSYSEDATREIVQRYEQRYDFVHLSLFGGTRGAGRNFGIQKARGEAVSFIDGDAIANPFWLRELREGFVQSEIVAGRTIQIGYRPFEELERIELIIQGIDVTHPSSNLAYRKSVLDEIGGFDEWFMTAEDIDLNIRAVQAGHEIAFRPNAIVYHRTRGSIYDFLRQAFWNGAGRKQLTLKHGVLWNRYRPGRMLRQSPSFWSLLRLSAALLGYVGYKAFGKPLPR